MKIEVAKVTCRVTCGLVDIINLYVAGCGRIKIGTLPASPMLEEGPAQN